jgi:hypothetical protein
MNDYFKEFVDKNEKLDSNLAKTRANTRDIIYKMIVLSSGIVGLSVTIASLNFVSNKVNLQTLYYSWFSFLFTISTGFLALFFESRLEHALTWRASILHGNVSPDEVRNLRGFKRLKLYFVLLLCLLRPENIYLDKLTSDDRERGENLLLSWSLVDRLARFKQFSVFWLENVFFIFFVTSLVIFVSSFKLNSPTAMPLPPVASSPLVCSAGK